MTENKKMDTQMMEQKDPHRGGHHHHKRDRRSSGHKAPKENLKPGSARYIWHNVSHNPGAMLGMILIVLILVLSLLSPYICRYSYSQIDMLNAKQPPSLEHLLGTDEMGRDMLSRVL